MEDCLVVRLSMSCLLQGLVDCPLTGRTLWQGVERPCWLNMRKIAAESLDHLLGLPPDVLGY